MTLRWDRRFHEQATYDEIELYAELLIATGRRDHVLSPAEIDQALGVREREAVAAAAR